MSNIRYPIDNLYAITAESALLYITKSKYEDDWHSMAHTHDFTEIFYITKGKGIFFIEGRHFNVTSEQMVIINSNLEHTEKSSGEHALEYIVIGIDNLLFNFNQPDNKGYSILDFHNNSEILFYFNKLIEETSNQLTNYQNICQHLLQALLLTLSRNTAISYNLIKNATASKECAEIKRYIENNYKQKITLDELSEISHLSKYYLVHNFSKTFGISPINYLIKIRVEESKYLLSSTNYSLSQICQITGFSSLSYFSQSFKKLTGIAPIEYRKQNKN